MEKKIFFVVVLVLLLSLIGCFGTGKGALKGKIYDDQSEQLITVNAKVFVGNKECIASEGDYSFTDLKAGKATLKVQAPGYKAYSAQVTIKANTTVEKDIYLEKELLEEVLVPGSPDFPIGEEDVERCTEVDYEYYMAKYPVTYGLWEEVFNWATDSERGTGQYFFLNEGNQGGGDPDITKTDLHPVTEVSWRDAVVWCNALTEYYNEKEGKNLQCAYVLAEEIVRDSRGESGELIPLDSVTPGEEADGFRLPSYQEWELAARYRDGTEWTPGMHVSGDESGPCYDGAGNIENLSEVFGDYAWYYDNSDYSTQEVGQKLPNALGIYDMCGNVAEWCFDWDPEYVNSARIFRGGSFNAFESELTIAGYYSIMPWHTTDSDGFRVVRNK